MNRIVLLTWNFGFRRCPVVRCVHVAVTMVRTSMTKIIMIICASAWPLTVRVKANWARVRRQKLGVVWNEDAQFRDSDEGGVVWISLVVRLGPLRCSRAHNLISVVRPFNVRSLGTGVVDAAWYGHVVSANYVLLDHLTNRLRHCTQSTDNKYSATNRPYNATNRPYIALLSKSVHRCQHKIHGSRGVDLCPRLRGHTVANQPPPH